MRAVSSKTSTSDLRSTATTTQWAVLFLGTTLALAACKKEKETCKPEDKVFAKIRVVVQSEQINLDTEGTPSATTLRIYQIKGGRSLDIPLDFREVWKTSGETFGDELLKEEELTIYPDKPDVFEIEPDPEATHVVAAAIFREPVGNAWYSEWEVPLFHGDSVCAAEKKKQVYEDPCFLIFMEGSLIDGGHEPPPGMDEDLIPITCPPPPLKVKPAEPTKKKKKRKKGKLKDKAGDAQEKGAEGQDKAGQAEDANSKAQGAGDAVSDPPVPGKD